MGIDFALKHFEIIILVGLKSIEVFFLFGVKATHTHTFGSLGEFRMHAMRCELCIL